MASRQKPRLGILTGLVWILLSDLGYGQVRGQILIPSARATERIELILERNRVLYSRIYTDSLGNYTIDNLGEGEFTLVVKVEGYKEVREDITFGRGGTTLTIALEPEDPKAPTATEDSPPVVDLEVLRRKYSKDVIEEYEDALEDNARGNMAKAVERLENVIERAPDFDSAHTTLGVSYQKMQRYPDAEREYSRALELNPNSDQAMLNLGSLYIQVVDENVNPAMNGTLLEDATRLLTQSIEINPRSATAYYLLGAVDYKRTAYDKAQQSVGRALELDPRLGTAHLLMANVYMRRQQWANALQSLDTYLNQNPNASDRAQIQDARSRVAERVSAAPSSQ